MLQGTFLGTGVGENGGNRVAKTTGAGSGAGFFINLPPGLIGFEVCLDNYRT
jgi:hypothetical protein